METSPTPIVPDQQPEPDTLLIDLEGVVQPGDTSTVINLDGNLMVSDHGE